MSYPALSRRATPPGGNRAQERWLRNLRLLVRRVDPGAPEAVVRVAVGLLPGLWLKSKQFSGGTHAAPAVELANEALTVARSAVRAEEQRGASL